MDRNPFPPPLDNTKPPKGVHPIDVVPPANVASPGELPHLAQERDLPFWRPTWDEVFRNLGWRCVFFLPLIAVLAALIAIPWEPGLLQVLIFGGWKLTTFIIALSLALAARATRRLVARRSEPFCIHCGYDLTGLADGGNCPECGRPFHHRIIDEYRRDPAWFVARYRRHHAETLIAPSVRFEAGAVRRTKSRDGT